MNKIGMICFAKPGLTGELLICIVQNEEFSICTTRTLDKPILSLERMIHKEYDRKGSVAKEKSLVMGLKGLEVKTNWLAVTANRKVTLTLTLNGVGAR
jgi:hypothetical protein